jgi:signal transduction histidine kinase
MRVAQKLNVAFSVAAALLMAGGVAAVYFISNLNEFFRQIDATNLLLEQVADASVNLRTEPRATKENVVRLQDLRRWARSAEQAEQAGIALQALLNNNPSAAHAALDKLGRLGRDADNALHHRLRQLHRHATIAVVFAVFDGALLLVILAWFVRETFLRPALRLRAAAGEIARGQPPPPMRLDGADEYSELADAVNEVAKTVQQQKERIERLERLAAVGETCAHIAHNVRSLLGGMKTLAQYERDAPTATNDSRAAFDYILGTTEALDRWAGDIVRAVRPLELKRARQSLEPIVHDVLAMWQPKLSERKLNVKFEPDDSVSEVLVDRQLMQQAISALLCNAIEASPEGGHIELRAANGSDGQVTLGVQDEGDGIADSVKEKVFAPFFSTKDGSAGLGLTIAQRIISEHGGRIAVESAAGKGTRATIALPAAPANRSGR